MMCEMISLRLQSRKMGTKNDNEDQRTTGGYSMRDRTRNLRIVRGIRRQKEIKGTVRTNAKGIVRNAHRITTLLQEVPKGYRRNWIPCKPLRSLRRQSND